MQNDVRYIYILYRILLVKVS